MRRVIPLLAILAVAVVVSAVLLSNVSEFKGPLAGGVITIGPINSGGILGETGGVLSFTNGTAKSFGFNATNEVNRTVAFNLSLSFFLHGIVNGGFTVLDFSWTINGFPLAVVLSPNATASWFVQYPSSLAPFASRTYELVITFSFIGAGDYTLRIWASS